MIQRKSNPLKSKRGQNVRFVEGTIPTTVKAVTKVKVEDVQEVEVIETPKKSVKNLINKGKKERKDNRTPFDYEIDAVKPNTFNFDYQPKIMKVVRNTVKRSPNDTIISSIVSTMTEKFSFFRVGTTYPFEDYVITSNIYTITNAKSGAGKDLGARVTNELFEGFDSEIHKTIDWGIARYGKNVDEIIARVHDNKDKVEELKTMKYFPHKSYTITEATNEGLMANIETFMKLGVGSVSWKIQEMGDMLLEKSDGSLSMKLVKELYDSSSTYNKQIKGGHNVNISGVPFNVIGYTSPQGLNDEINRQKIAEKMARGNVRRFHVVSPTNKEYPSLSKAKLTTDQRLSKLKQQKENSGALSFYKDKFERIAEELQAPLMDSIENEYTNNAGFNVPGLTYKNRPKGKVFEWDDEAAVYFDEYNDSIDERWFNASDDDGESIGDLGYKVIKLLPMYCILNGSDTITLKDVKQTIYMVEYFYSHTHNTKAQNEIVLNKIYDFLIENKGEYFSKTELIKKARLSTRYERGSDYLQQAADMFDDDTENSISIYERGSAKKIVKYAAVDVEEVSEEDEINLEDEILDDCEMDGME